MEESQGERERLDFLEDGKGETSLSSVVSRLYFGDIPRRRTPDYGGLLPQPAQQQPGGRTLTLAQPEPDR